MKICGRRCISTGAANDLARVTDIASAMVLRYGMTEALGHVAYDRGRSPFLQGILAADEPRAYGEDTARAVNAAVRALVDAGFARSVRILERNRALLDRTPEQLLKTETLDKAEIEVMKRQIITASPVKAA